MSFSENKGLWLSVAILGVIMGALLWIVFSGRPLKLIVLFEEVGDLKRDDPVVWKSFTIGKVADIRPLVNNQIGVTIELKEDYVSQITHGAEFYLKPGSLLGLLGSDSIEVITPASPGTPFSSGEKVQGRRRANPSLLELGKQWTLEHWQQLKDETNQLVEDLQESPFRQDVEDALRQLEKLTAEGANQAREKADEFRKAHEKDLEAIRKKLERVRDAMRHKGDERDAGRLEKELEKIR